MCDVEFRVPVRSPDMHIVLFVGVEGKKIYIYIYIHKEAVAKGQDWRISINACGHGEGGGKSAGVAVGCRKHMGMAESFADEELPDELRGRFTVKHIGAV